MATAPDWRNQGIGTGLIQYLFEDLQKSDQVRPIWSNARVSSAKFYRELGWREVSEQFENGNAGLSVQMLRGEEKTLATGQVSGAGVESRIGLR
ncbi:GNAT family N-acetyltransferase [Acaryochloris marina]|uniref:GNAT family N-acetyltransferase n=1 Tax=Acaryochloris marina TaxID=155978 RepID=UPI0020180B9D|nr:GNAT family N-acetyltransferase [Acaryochloris marina]